MFKAQRPLDRSVMRRAAKAIFITLSGRLDNDPI